MSSTKLSQIAKTEAPLAPEALAAASGGCGAIPNALGDQAEAAMAAAVADMGFPCGDAASLPADGTDGSCAGLPDEDVVSHFSNDSIDLHDLDALNEARSNVRDLAELMHLVADARSALIDAFIKAQIDAILKTGVRSDC